MTMPIISQMIKRSNVSPGSFFFQAEDGIRDHCVTGVQTCALPIFRHAGESRADARLRGARSGGDRARECPPGGAPLFRQGRMGEDRRRHLPGDLHRGRTRHGAPRQSRVRRSDSDRGHRHPRPPMDRPPATRLVGPRGARPRRAATIVKNLLSFARSQEGERTRQAIRALLDSTLALLRNQLMAHKVEATVEVEPGLPDVEVNANQIKQVFVNVINNACQAIASDAPSGRIWITARRVGDSIAVSVTDSGPGMTEELAARVFEPFFTTKREGEGTGLGLSICQGIMKEHGGRITLDTRPGAGATFTLELPIGARVARTEAAPVPAGESKPVSILVVDDEPHILHYMRATLESWGHTVEVAGDGTHARERARAGPFDVIICDLRMPHVSGREMYTKLARQDPRVAERIIFATGDTVRGDTLKSLEALARPYRHKPSPLADLRAPPAHPAKQPAEGGRPGPPRD